METNPAVDAVLSQGFEKCRFTWNLKPQPFTEVELERRKIYNTKKYPQSNVGHEFTAVPTDLERKALVEYLKTL